MSGCRVLASGHDGLELGSRWGHVDQPRSETLGQSPVKVRAPDRRAVAERAKALTARVPRRRLTSEAINFAP